jgi:hypothetical protein
MRACGLIARCKAKRQCDLWSSTHTNVHPVQTSYRDTLATVLEYATAIKAVDHKAKVLGRPFQAQALAYPAS